MKDIVIIGSGGFAREVRFVLNEINRVAKTWRFIGFIDTDNEGKPDVIGNDQYLMEFEDELNVVFGIGSPQVIAKLVSKFKHNRNLIFPNIIHPNVIGEWSRIKLGEGNIICGGNCLTTDIEIGSFNIINLSCTVGHDARIGDYNVINPSVNVSGGVKIKNRSFFGTGAQLIHNINVDEESIIGAGSVLTKSTIGSGTYVGVPAKKIK